MSPKRDLSGFAAPGGLPDPPPPPASAGPAAPAVDSIIDVRTRPPAVPDAADPQRATPASARIRGARRSAAAPAPAPAVVAPKGRPGRQRICVSLTLETYEQLARLADDRDCWKVELVVEALGKWETQLQGSAADGTAGRFRRRRSSTPTPYVMDLTPDELARLDGLATTVSLSRSALVRRLIVLEAEHDTTSVH